MKKNLHFVSILVALLCACKGSTSEKTETNRTNQIQKSNSGKTKSKGKHNNKTAAYSDKELNVKRIQKENISVSKKFVDKNDLYLADKKYVVFISPNASEIKDMKKKYGQEDFYIVADDINFYRHQASEFLKSKTITSCYTDKRFLGFVRILGDTVFVDTNKIKSKWAIVLCNADGKPFSSELNELELNFEQLDE